MDSPRWTKQSQCLRPCGGQTTPRGERPQVRAIAPWADLGCAPLSLVWLHSCWPVLHPGSSPAVLYWPDLPRDTDECPLPWWLCCLLTLSPRVSHLPTHTWLSHSWVRGTGRNYSIDDFIQNQRLQSLPCLPMYSVAPVGKGGGSFSRLLILGWPYALL